MAEKSRFGVDGREQVGDTRIGGDAFSQQGPDRFIEEIAAGDEPDPRIAREQAVDACAHPENRRVRDAASWRVDRAGLHRSDGGLRRHDEDGEQRQGCRNDAPQIPAVEDAPEGFNVKWPVDPRKSVEGQLGGHEPERPDDPREAQQHSPAVIQPVVVKAARPPYWAATIANPFKSRRIAPGTVNRHPRGSLPSRTPLGPDRFARSPPLSAMRPSRAHCR